MVASIVTLQEPLTAVLSHLTVVSLNGSLRVIPIQNMVSKLDT